MAEVKINISTGSLQGLQNLSRQVETTKQQLDNLGKYEALPGGGIRLRGYEPPSSSDLGKYEALPGGGIRLKGYTGSQTAGTYGPPSVAMPPPSIIPRPGNIASAADALTQARPQIDAYTRALGQVDNRARLLFLTLRDLGQRNRDQGFLGREDTRQLQTTQNEWQRMSRRLDADLQGARARVAATPEGRARTQAEVQAERLEAQQRAMAQLERSIPPGGLPPGGFGGIPGGDGGGMLGTMRTGFARLQRIARATLGVTTGFGAYQLLSQAMHDYETRAMGVLRVGTMLDQNYDRLDTSIRDLRQQYHVLGQEGVGAMEALARITGRTSGLTEAIRYGRAYGIEPEQAATLQGQLSRLTGNAVPNLGAIAAVHREIPAWQRPLSLGGPFEEATLGVGEVGGTGFLPLSEEQYGRFAGLMTGFGPRYAGNPAAAYAQFAGGLGRQVAAPFQSLRERAISELAQRSPTLRIGNETLNIRSSYRDYRQAMELAAQIPAVQQAYFEQAQRQGGGNEDLSRFYFQELFGDQSITRTNQMYKEYADRAKRPGGIAASLRPRLTPADNAAEVETQEARIAQARLTPGGQIRERQADVQALSESGMVQLMEKMRTEMMQALGSLVQGINDHKSAVDIARDSFDKLSSTTLVLNGVLGTLTGHYMLGGGLLAAGLGRMAGERSPYPLGFNELTEHTQPWEGQMVPLLGGPSLLRPHEMNLVPRK